MPNHITNKLNIITDAECIRECADWGVHPCTSWEDFNNLLESIGEEAYENAAVPLDDKDESKNQGMGGIA